MFKFLLIGLSCLAAIVGALAIYLLTGESFAKTILLAPPSLSVFYLLYEELSEKEEFDAITTNMERPVAG